GKSILLGGILLCLGKRSAGYVIRTGAESALAELTFTADTEELKNALSERNIFPEEGVYRLSRRVFPDKSIARINGETVPLKMLREIASLFIDVYGQHEQNDLLSEDHHEKILDAFPSAEVTKAKNDYRDVYDRYRKAKALNDRVGQSVTEQSNRIDYLKFALQELDETGLKKGEEEKLRSELKKLRYAEHLRNSLNEVRNALDENALPSVGDSIRTVREMTAYDAGLKAALSLLYDAEALLGDASREIGEQTPEADNEESIDAIESRLETIGRVKEKYGPNEEDVFRKQEDFSRELDELLQLTEKGDEIREAYEKARSSLIKAASDLHKARSRSAKRFDENMTETLRDLNFPKVVFRTSVEKTNRYTTHGADEVRFLFSANPGEPVRPIDLIASGGELSRIMLAMKTQSTLSEEAGRTLLFDEIDSGISGRTATDVGTKLAEIAKDNQVIAISHLPQIVAKADGHFKIEKSFSDTATETIVTELSGEESVREIARLLGTGEITEASLKNAMELKNG
ncbi:MAG: DNA repair protein RecN, partial [Lachnospiraceae bacterium]|nr:DNA repair protein RecN [Lachnospiraceae bacterium]